MTIKIGSNLASLNAQRKLGEAEASLSKVFERLSSGQRINRASDDAAGLAIADDLKAKNRIYAQALRNGNDGISLLNIADSAIEALSGVVTRIRELSEQAANGTYSDKQRAALDAEAQALSKEFTRITQTTSFNGIKLFNGSLGQGVRLQLGIGISESINASVGGAVGTGTFGMATQYSADGRATRAVSLGDINGDGILDMVTAGQDQFASHGTVTVRLGNGDGSFGVSTSYTSEANYSFALSLGDINADGILDVVSAGLDDFANGWATVRLGNGDGTFGSASMFSAEAGGSYAVSLGDLNSDGMLDLVTAGIDDSSNGWATVRLGTGNGSFGSAQRFTTEAKSSYAVSLEDVNQDNIIDLITTGNDDADNGWTTIRLGNGDGTFGSSVILSAENGGSFALTLDDLNNDGIIDLISAGMDDSVNGLATVRLGTGNGTFGSANSFTTEAFASTGIKLGDINGDGILDLVTAGYDEDQLIGAGTIRLGSGNGSFAAANSFTTESYYSTGLSLGDLNGDGVLDLVTAGYSDFFDGIATVRLSNVTEGLGAILNFSLKTKADALQSIGILDRTIENLAKQRGTIGASQSRVSIALNNLQSARENFSAAESRIRDADVAAESAALIRTQILQQAAAAVLSQANQQPSLALQLLS